jgi:DNA-binding transcriptional regulator YhcF (GntR family)
MSLMDAAGARRKDNASLYYQLTSEEWLRACKELKPSEKEVLYYLRTLDPFGEKDLDIGVREMARALGMSPSTVSRALKELDRKEWIDMEITSARVKLHSQQASCGEVLPPRNRKAVEKCCLQTYDLSDLLVAIDQECTRLGLTRDAATQRLGLTFGWEPRAFDDLTTEDDLVLLHSALRDTQENKVPIADLPSGALLRECTLQRSTRSVLYLEARP